MDFNSKPDTTWIQQVVTHLTGLWSDTHARNSVRDSYYNRTFSLWPEGVKRPILRPAKPRAIIDHAVDQIAGSSATVRRFGEKHKEDNDKVERAMQAIFHQASLREPNPTFKQIAKNLALYGYAVVEVALDSKDLQLARDEEPEGEKGETSEELKRRKALWEHRRRTVMPFRIRAPHPQRVLLDPMEKQPYVAVKTGVWLAQTLHDITAARKKAGRGTVHVYEVKDNPFEPVPCIEYWVEEWHSLITLANDMLIVEPNTWRFVPFGHAFSGRGQEPSNITQINPEWQAVGFLDHLMDDMKANAQDMAARHNMLLEAAFMPMGTTQPAEQVEEQLATSGMVELPSRTDLWYLERPQLPRQLQDIDAALLKDIEDGTYTRAVSGVRDVGVNTVGQQAILNTAGQRAFITMSEQVSHLATKAGEQIAQLIDILDLKLEVEGHEISRSDLNNDYSMEVKFEITDPVLRLQERQQALAELQAGVRSLESFWVLAGVEDVTGERERIAEDMVYAHPLVQEQFAKLAAQRLGLAHLLAQEAARGGGAAMGAGAQAGGQQQSQILGPDGMPLQSTLGTTGPQQAAQQVRSGMNALRQPLTPQAARPGRNGQNLAG